LAIPPLFFLLYSMRDELRLRIFGKTYQKWKILYKENVSRFLYNAKYINKEEVRS